MKKRTIVLLSVMFFLILPIVGFAGGKQEEKAEVEFVWGLGEYLSVVRQLMDRYEAEKPNVKVIITVTNEDTEAAYRTRVAGEKGGDIHHGAQVHMPVLPTDPSSPLYYADLKQIGAAKWLDKFNFDHQAYYDDVFKATNAPIYTLGTSMATSWSFIYDVDLMDRTGIKPQREIRSWDDFYQFVSKLRSFADTDPGLNRVWDLGFHRYGTVSLFQAAAESANDWDREKLNAFFGGKGIPLNDPNSPLKIWPAMFIKLKELGVLKDYPTRGWGDHEDAWIAGRSILLFHAHWPWDKMVTERPDVNLSGFPFPTESGKNRTILCDPAGPGMYCIPLYATKRPHIKQTVDLFNWWQSPEPVALLSEALGQVYAYKYDRSLEIKGKNQSSLLLAKLGKGDLADVTLSDKPNYRTLYAKYLREGATLYGWWDNATCLPALTAVWNGEKPVKYLLDTINETWKKSYDFSAVK